jgi:hypothetical protein
MAGNTVRLGYIPAENSIGLVPKTIALSERRLVSVVRKGSLLVPAPIVNYPTQRGRE